MVTDAGETEYKKISESSITFSPTGKWFVFVSKKDKTWYAIINGLPETSLYDDTFFRLLQFSPDEKRISYVAANSSIGCHIFIDGKADSLNFNNIASSRFSPDSQHLVYFGWKENSKLVAVVDGVESMIEMDGLLEFTPVFSPNSKHLVYAGKQGRRWFMVIDGVKSEEYLNIAKGSPVFSTTGDSIGYIASKGFKWNLFINNQITDFSDFSTLGKGFVSLKIIEDYFQIKPENRCPLLVNNLESSDGFLGEVNIFTISYPVGIYIHNTDENNQAKLENGINYIGLQYKEYSYNPSYIYSDLKLRYSTDNIPIMNVKLYFNAQSGKVYTVKTGSSSRDFISCIYLGEKYIGVVDITETYVRE
jgi:hypothetical protein